jgi:hypothetical protein
MFYGLRVNSALARLGIPPTLIENNFRRSLQQVGEASGNTPQEVAVFIAAELPMIHRINLPPSVCLDACAYGIFICRSQALEYLKLLVELAKAIAWPVAVLLIGLMFKADV